MDVCETSTNYLKKYLGSTFLGELFNRNPEVFYLFEPLAGVQGEHSTLACYKYPEAKIAHLKKYFTCNAPLYYDNFRHSSRTPNKKIIVEAKKFMLVFFQSLRNELPCVAFSMSTHGVVCQYTSFHREFRF